MLKPTCFNGKVIELPYIKTLLQNITDDSCFQNFKFRYVERVKIAISNNTVIWTDKVNGCVKSRLEDDSHKDILQAAYKVLNSWTLMGETPKENTTGSGCGCETEHVEDNGNDEQSDGENGKYCDIDNKNDVNSAENPFCFTEGDSSIDLWTKEFESRLLNAGVQISSLRMEYKSLHDYVKENYKTENMDYIAIWRSIFCLEAVEVTDYSNILKLVELCLSFAIANAKSEAGFCHMKRVENNYSSQLGEEALSFLIRMRMDGKLYAQHDSIKAVEAFLQQKNWKYIYAERKRSCSQSTNEDSKTKKTKKVSECTKNIYFTYV